MNDLLFDAAFQASTSFRSSSRGHQPQILTQPPCGTGILWLVMDQSHVIGWLRHKDNLFARSSSAAHLRPTSPRHPQLDWLLGFTNSTCFRIAWNFKRLIHISPTDCLFATAWSSFTATIHFRVGACQAPFLEAASIAVLVFFSFAPSSAALKC